MSQCGYTVKITNLSPNATEKDIRDFLEFCGAIQYVEIARDSEYACVAYVTFRNPHAAETAVLLSGTTILEEPICIARCERPEGEHNLHMYSTWKIEDEGTSSNHVGEIEPCGYTVEITSIPSSASEDDVNDFLQVCGAIQHIKIVRGEQSCAAYVTFKNAHAMETALLLGGSILLDHPVLITRCEHYKSDPKLWKHTTWKIEDERSANRKIPYAGEAVYVAKKMANKGYVLGRDTLMFKAKALDESHHFTATTAAMIGDFNRKIGLADKVFAGVEAARTANQKYGISNRTKSVVSAAGKTAFSAANAVASNSYFSKGTLWVSGALSRASQVAGDLGIRGAGGGK